MKNTLFPEESRNPVSGNSPGSYRRNLEFSGQPNKPMKLEESENTTVRRSPEFTGQPNKPMKQEESENTSVRRNPAFSGKPNKEESENTTLSLSGRERLKRHREEVAGKVSIPEKWGKEGLLENWMDFSAFDSAFTSNQILSARAALMADAVAGGRQRLRIESSC